MLSSIPGELLTSIVAYLDKRRDINALAQLDRRLYGTYNAFLYRFDAETPQCALDWAISQGQTGTARKALEAGAKVSLDALHKAANAGHVAIFTLLVETDDIHLNSEDEFGQTPFTIACRDGQTQIVQLLIDTYNVDVMRKDVQRQSPFFIACARGHLEIMKVLLKTGKVDTEAKNANLETPLAIAAKNGQTDAVKFLIGIYGIDLDARDRLRQTPLCQSISKNHRDVVEALLGTKKVDLLRVNGFNQTALMAATVACHDDNGIVALLLNQYISPEATDVNGDTALTLAAKLNRGYVVKLFLDSGQVDCDRIDAHGRTFLDIAIVKGADKVVDEFIKAEKGDIHTMEGSDDYLKTAVSRVRLELTELLLRKTNLDPSLKYSDGSTIFHKAVLTGNEAWVKMLLDSGKLDPDARDAHGRTPFSICVGYGSRRGYEMARAFYDRRIKLDVNVRHKRGGLTPFAAACDNNDIVMIKWLLEEYAVDLNPRYYHGSTPLIRAVCFNRQDTALLLIHTSGVNLNSQDAEGRSPLAWAVTRGNAELVRALLSKGGIKTDLGDVYGRTPLARAVERGSLRIVEMLLETKKVDPTTADRWGRTPLSRALRCRHFAFEHMMQAYCHEMRYEIVKRANSVSF